MTTPISQTAPDFQAIAKDIAELRKLHDELVTPEMRREVQEVIEELVRRYRRH